MEPSSTNDSNVKKYRELQEMFIKANPNMSKDKCQIEANRIWKSVKTEVGKKKRIEVDNELFSREITLLKAKISKKKSNMYDFLSSKKSRSQTSDSVSTSGPPASVSQEARESVPVEVPPDSMEIDSSEVTTETSKDGDTETADDSRMNTNSPADLSEADDAEEAGLSRDYDKPVQNKVRDELAAIDSRLASLNEARNLGIGDENVARITKQIKELREKRNEVSKKLSRLKAGAQSQKKFRDKTKKKLAKAIEQYPALASQITLRDGPGQPPLEDVYPDMHQVLLEIATVGAAASDRRRADLFRTVKTLDDLHKALTELGYSLSRSALYLRLIPRNASTREGKRHINTVPVKYENIIFSFYLVNDYFSGSLDRRTT